MPKVSVIVPFYNVSPYIERCAESLMRQTLDQIEFIFVDDASPDDSRRILETVISRYPKRDVTILTHNVNKGLPASRNTGLFKASGDYIYHCDSDDYLEPDMLEKLYDTAIGTSADLVYCDFYLSFESEERYMSNPYYVNGMNMLTGGFLSGAMKYNVWNKLVKRTLYSDAKIVFPEGHSMGEDMTMIMLCAKADRVSHVPSALYHYVKLNSNAFTNTFSTKHIEDIKYNSERTIKFLKEIKGIGERDIALFKLSVKLPFLFSSDKRQYELWSEWYPEANKYIKGDKEISCRTRIVQYFASKGQFWLVSAYSNAVNLFYKLHYGRR